MEKLFLGIIKHYYWILVAIAASIMFGFRDTSSAFIVVVVIATVICAQNIKFEQLDFFVVLYIIYNLITGIVGSLPDRLFYLGVRSEIIPICFYFIARSEQFKNEDFFLNMRRPLLFAMACGLFFYFVQPSFYVQFKVNDLWSTMNIDATEISGYLLYEVSRLSSFWPHSYFMGYASLFIFILTTKRIIVDNAFSKLDSISMIVSFFCLFFAQQRVSIAFAILYLVLLTIYAAIHRLKNRKYLYALWFFSIVFGIAIAAIAVIVLGDGFVTYIVNRSVNYDGNMVGDRFAMFSQFMDRLSTFGDGLGRYGHGAVYEGFKGIPDCDYMRIPCEIGFVGLFMLLYFCTSSIVKGLFIFRYCLFEICCLVFVLIAMLGAAPWELGVLHPFLYWFCIGHIQSKFLRRDELEEEYEAYIQKENPQEESEEQEEDEK